MNSSARLSDPSTQGSSQPSAGSGQEAPLFDLEAALETLGCADLLREAAGAFVTMAPDLVSETAQALRRGDWPGLRSAAHTWKGASGYLGASAIVDLAAQLEEQAAAARIEGIETLVERLLAGSRGLAAELSEWLGTPAPTVAE